MNYKLLSILLAIVLFVAFLFIAYKAVTTEEGEGWFVSEEEPNATEEVEETFGEPPEDFEPPAAPG